jgi:hypothetical protein
MEALKLIALRPMRRLREALYGTVQQLWTTKNNNPEL